LKLEHNETARPNTAFQSDRFAREIVAILTQSRAARSRRLNAKPLDGDASQIVPDQCANDLTISANNDILTAIPAVTQNAILYDVLH